MPQLPWVMTHKTHDGVGGVVLHEGSEGQWRPTGLWGGGSSSCSPGLLSGACTEVPSTRLRCSTEIRQAAVLTIPGLWCGAGTAWQQAWHRGVGGRAQLRELQWVESNTPINTPWKWECSHKEGDFPCTRYSLYSNETTGASPVEIYLKK